MNATRRALADLSASLGLQDAFPVLRQPGFVFDESLMKILLWTALACGLAALAWHLADILPKRLARQTRWGEAGSVEAIRGAGGIAAARESADELARQGRVVEAMHVLLLQGLAEMRQRLDQRFADSLTSREILRRAPVPPEGRLALGELIAGVERAYFGDHPAGAAEYAYCRQRFEALSAALNAGSQA